MDLAEPVAMAMSPQIETIDETASVYEGLLFMSHRRIHHLPVVNHEGQLVRVVSMNQVRDPFVGEVDMVMGQIDEAGDIEHLEQLSRQARSLGINLSAQHGDSGLLTSVLSALNDAIARRAIELVAVDYRLPDVPWCWMVMGSEGRFEQTFHTDQDNGLIFSAENAKEAAELREYFLPLAKRVNDYLDRCGVPHCSGGIMAGNPECCLSLKEWQERFFQWIRMPDAKSLINATIFFDYRPLYGDDSLAKSLRDYLMHLARDQGGFFRLLASNALEATPPIGTLRDFVTTMDADKQRTVDLKKFGARIFVDAARIFALSSGVSQTNTVARLRASGKTCGIHPKDIDSAVQAFAQLQRIRMSTQLRSGHTDNKNLLDPNSLHRLDRKILHESFIQAQQLQSQLRRSYAL
jgi:CBS domain-containing protein